MKLIIIAIPLLAGIITQLIKLLLGYKKHPNITFKDLFSYGGMPSSHAAIVAGLVAVTLLIDGISSLTFLISIVFYIIIIRDAIGYRREIGFHAKRLNQISNKLKLGSPPLTERMGHTVKEVFWGTVLGFTISLILLYLFYFSIPCSRALF